MNSSRTCHGFMPKRRARAAQAAGDDAIAAGTGEGGGAGHESSVPMLRARVEDIELEYELSGTGDPVVLIHAGVCADSSGRWI